MCLAILVAHSPMVYSLFLIPPLAPHLPPESYPKEGRCRYACLLQQIRRPFSEMSHCPPEFAAAIGNSLLGSSHATIQDSDSDSHMTELV